MRLMKGVQFFRLVLPFSSNIMKQIAGDVIFYFFSHLTVKIEL